MAFPLALIGAGISLLGNMEQQKRSRAAGKFQAKQLRQQAGQQRAFSQQAAIDTQRQGDLARSRALAVAGKSGTDVSSPGIIRQLSDFDSEILFRTRLALAAGEERARGLETGAAASLFNADLAAQQSGAQTAAGLFANSEAIGRDAGGVVRGSKTLFERFRPNQGFG